MDGPGWEKHVISSAPHDAGPRVLHGPPAEPDHPALAPAGLAAVVALVEMAAADGVPVVVEHPAERTGSESALWPLPSAWLRLDGGGGVGLMAWGRDSADDHPETAADEAVRVADTAHEALVEWMPGYGRPTNWPPCPEHPTTHPLQLVAGSDADPRPRWSCPLTGVVTTALPPLGEADPV